MRRAFASMAVVGVLALVGAAGCGGGNSEASDEATPATTEALATTPAKGKTSVPAPAADPSPTTKKATPKPPAAATDQEDESFVYLGGSAQIEKDFIGDFSARIRVRNDGSKRTAIMSVSLLKNDSVVATLLGSALDVEEGKTLTVDMISSDNYVRGPYDVEFTVDGAY